MNKQEQTNTQSFCSNIHRVAVVALDVIATVSAAETPSPKPVT